MPPLPIACLALTMACLLWFGILANRTGKTEPPRGVWLIWVAAIATLLMVLVVVAGWAGVPIFNAVLAVLALGIGCVVLTACRRIDRAVTTGDMGLLVHGLAWGGIAVGGLVVMVPVGWGVA